MAACSSDGVTLGSLLIKTRNSFHNENQDESYLEIWLGRSQMAQVPGSSGILIVICHQGCWQRLTVLCHCLTNIIVEFSGCVLLSCNQRKPSLKGEALILFTGKGTAAIHLELRLGLEKNSMMSAGVWPVLRITWDHGEKNDPLSHYVSISVMRASSQPPSFRIVTQWVQPWLGHMLNN